MDIVLTFSFLLVFPPLPVVCQGPTAPSIATVVTPVDLADNLCARLWWYIIRYRVVIMLGSHTLHYSAILE